MRWHSARYPNRWVSSKITAHHHPPLHYHWLQWGEVKWLSRGLCAADGGEFDDGYFDIFATQGLLWKVDKHALVCSAASNGAYVILPSVTAHWFWNSILYSPNGVWGQSELKLAIFLWYTPIRRTLLCDGISILLVYQYFSSDCLAGLLSVNHHEIFPSA